MCAGARCARTITRERSAGTRLRGSAADLEDNVPMSPARFSNRPRVAAALGLWQRTLGSAKGRTLKTLTPGRCWWCDAPADSREHRYKRTDIIREHGKGTYHGDATPGRIGADGRRDAQSARSNVFKFEASMCQVCNNKRSQPFDRAYDAFIECLWANESDVLANRRVDLKHIWGEQWSEEALHVLRYFVKHACCRVAELTTVESPTYLPLELIAFMDGDEAPSSFSMELTVEPVQVTMETRHRDDPLWKRWLGVDPLFGGRNDGCYYESRSRYGWLTCSWLIDTKRGFGHAFANQVLALPVVATQFDIPFEFAMVAAPDAEAGDTHPPPARPETGSGDSSLPLARAHELRVNRAFMAGLLDFDYALDHGGPPDERRNIYDNLPETVDTAAELMRVQDLISYAEGWVTGKFGQDPVAARSAGPAPFEPERLKVLSAAIQASVVGPPSLDAAKHFASMSALKLAEAAELGIDSAVGQDSALEAARYAGACLSAAANAYGQRPEAYIRSVD